MRDPYVTLMGRLGELGALPPTPQLLREFVNEANPFGVPRPSPPPPAKAKPKGSGWPGASAQSASHWSSAGGVVRYILHSGDTLSGLSSYYLGQPERWREIWSLNSSGTGPGSFGAWRPDRIPVGAKLVMPPDAVTRARTLGYVSADVVPQTSSLPPDAAPPKASVPSATPNTAAGARATGATTGAGAAKAHAEDASGGAASGGGTTAKAQPKSHRGVIVAGVAGLVAVVAVGAAVAMHHHAEAA